MEETQGRMSKREVLSLDEHAQRLLARVGAPHRVPPFDAIVLLETADPAVEYLAGPDGRWRWCAPASALRSIPEFSSRFDGYLRSGYSWVNLSIYGVLGTRLVLGIELPPKGPTGTPVGWTAVNYSGPPLDVQTQSPVWQARLEIRG